jgi:hypothetical protein
MVQGAQREFRDLTRHRKRTRSAFATACAAGSGLPAEWNMFGVKEVERPGAATILKLDVYYTS